MTLSRRTTLLTAAACAVGPRASAQPRQSVAIRIDWDPEVLDPAFRTGLQDGNLCRAIFQRLFTMSPGGELVADAASELRQVSPTVVEFVLKPGQVFTGGFGEMTADDVKFSFERFAVAAPDGKVAPNADDWANLREVEVTGRYTGRIVLTKPRASLMKIAIGDVSGSIVCRKAVEQLGAAHNTRPVGSGPLMLRSLEKQRGAVLVRNPDYRGTPAGFAEVAVRTVGDPKTAELALRAGELDFGLVPPQAVRGLRGAAGLTVSEMPGIANVWIGLNVEKKPFDDPRVRQAFRMALDVEQMLLAGYDGRATRADALVMPSVLGHWKDAPKHRRDVAGAKRLLAEAGMPGGFACTMVVQNQPVYQTMALVAQALLAEAGIRLAIEARDAGAFFSSGKGEAGRGLDAFMIRFNGKLDPNYLAQWFTAAQVGVWNWQRWSDPAFDALLDEAAAELDEGKRAALIVRAQERMEASGAFVWLTWDTTTIAHRASVAPALLPTGIDWQLDRFAPA